MSVEADPEPVTGSAPPLTGRVLMSQDWRDLTFLHWAVPPEQVAAAMPRGVRPDVLDGVSYVGLVPFRMVGAGPGRRLPVPWLGTFLETNVRLYSRDATGRRGVVFCSLDCDRLAVVAGARAGFGLPYRWAQLRLTRAGSGVEYDARVRAATGRATGPASRLRVRIGDPREATPLDHFLTARWGLHTSHAGLDLYVPHEHPPWPLHDAEVEALDDELVAAAGFPGLADRPPDHVAFSPGVHTRFGWPTSSRRPRRISGSAVG